MRNIMSSALFALPFLGYQPVNVSNGEPALTAANMTKQTMLGAPFSWPWNREHFVIQIPAEDEVGNPMRPLQDYSIQLQQYGFLEKAWLTDSKGQTKEIKIQLVLAEESSVQRPQSVAAQSIDDEDYVIFRLNSIPDQTYVLSGAFQKAPFWLSSLASSWNPIPDHLAYIYDWGFLSYVAMLTRDARFPIFAAKFVAHLLGAQDGLTALQRNIFLGNWLDVIAEPQRTQANTQQGIAARQQ
jgi:hypothetical protein